MAQPVLCLFGTCTYLGAGETRLIQQRETRQCLEDRHLGLSKRGWSNRVGEIF